MSVTVVKQDDGDTAGKVGALEVKMEQAQEQLEQQQQEVSQAQNTANMAMSDANAALSSSGMTRDEITGILDERLSSFRGEIDEWRNNLQSQMTVLTQPSTPETSLPGNNDGQSSQNVSNDTEQNAQLEPEEMPTLPKPKTRFQKIGLFHRK